MENIIKIIEDLNETGVIGYSAHIELITAVREEQSNMEKVA